MRMSLVRCAALFALAFVGDAALVGAAPLKTVAFDDAQRLPTVVFTDAAARFNGKDSLRVKTAEPIKIRLFETSKLDVEDGTLLCSADVKSEKLQGAAYLEMWCEVDGGQSFSRGFDSTVSGTKDWKTIQTPFVFKKGQRPSNVIVNLVVDGSGTVWVGDLSLTKQ